MCGGPKVLAIVTCLWRRGDDHHFRALVPFHTVLVDVGGAGGAVAPVHRDLPHPAVGAQFHAGAQGHRPVGDVGAALRALGAAGVARAKIQTAAAAVVLARGDGAVGRPPMPTELVESARHRLAHAPEGNVRQRRLMVRQRRIAGQSGHPHVVVVLGEVGFQGAVADGPVVRHRVQRPHTEVRRMEAREVGGIQDCAAAHGVEVQDGDGRIAVVHRIVRGAVAQVGAGSELPRRRHLPVPPGARILGRIHPPALLQADDAHARLGETPRHRRPGRAGADNQHIHDVVGHGLPPPAMDAPCCSTSHGNATARGTGRTTTALEASRPPHRVLTACARSAFRNAATRLCKPGAENFLLTSALEGIQSAVRSRGVPLHRAMRRAVSVRDTQLKPM